jgi:branched-chain amino acid transport system substrate-binding protein
MKKVLLIVMSMVLVLGMLSGCKPSTVSNDANSKDADTIRVGLNYELTGGAATYGQGLVDGIELAIEEVNKEGILGKKIEMLKYHTYFFSCIS